MCSQRDQPAAQDPGRRAASSSARVVSDINGVSARAMVSGLIEGQSDASACSAHARGALKRKTRGPRRQPGRRSQRTAPVRAAAHPTRQRRDAAARARRDRRLPAGRHAALRLGARAAADHPRHRRDRRRADPHRDRRRHGALRLRPSGWPAGPR
ncbi:MAG: hypothetical protein MZW92_41100 [Comamonadaceae bacterium]|nr:hypothetical protein [Comamonadaceae bacterium]